MIFYLLKCYRILLHLTNENDAEITVRLSLQEQFPVVNFDQKQPHVELADSVEPSEVKKQNTRVEMFL